MRLLLKVKYMYNTAAMSGTDVLVTSVFQKLLQSSQNQWGKYFLSTLLEEKFLQVVISPGYFELLQ